MHAPSWECWNHSYTASSHPLSRSSVISRTASGLLPPTCIVPFASGSSKLPPSAGWPGLICLRFMMDGRFYTQVLLKEVKVKPGVGLGHQVPRAARVQGVPWRGNGQQVVHSRSAAPKTEVVAGLIVSGGMLAQGPPGTEQSQSPVHRKCSTKVTSSCHVCGQAGLGTPMYSVTLRSCPREHLP